LRPDLESELWIWRPILAGKVALVDVKRGRVSVEDLHKLNALLDMQADFEAAQHESIK